VQERSALTIVVPVLYENLNLKSFFILRPELITEVSFSHRFQKEKPLLHQSTLLNETALIEEHIAAEEYGNSEITDREEVLNQVRAFHHFFFQQEEPQLLELHTTSKTHSEVALLAFFRALVLGGSFLEACRSQKEHLILNQWRAFCEAVSEHKLAGYWRSLLAMELFQQQLCRD